MPGFDCDSREVRPVQKGARLDFECCGEGKDMGQHFVPKAWQSVPEDRLLLAERERERAREQSDKNISDSRSDTDRNIDSTEDSICSMHRETAHRATCQKTRRNCAKSSDLALCLGLPNTELLLCD